MTTALEIIADALAEIGAGEVGQEVPADDSALCLRHLNRLLGLWSNNPAMYPVLPSMAVTLNGAASYTIGPTGDVVATRPLRIDRATALDASGNEYHVNVLSRAEWDAIHVKDVDASPPSDIWYDAQNSNGRVYVYPKATGYTLSLKGPGLVATFASTSTVLALPEGYESALVLSLALSVAPSFRVQASADLRARAAGAVRAISRTNTEALLLDIGLAGGDSYIIERGY